LEKLLELWNDNHYMINWNGHDGHDARVVCDTIEKVLEALDIEVDGINK
jgi:hypothetical protein